MLTQERQALRRRILQCRDSLSLTVRRAGSSAIAANLWCLEEFAAARALFIYVNFRSEVETLPLIRQCLEKGKVLCVPLTDRDHRRLWPYVITDPDRDLAPGSFGIPEPVAKGLRLMPAGSIDTVIVPGSVFDTQGGRLGYGSGYYDRFLANEAPEALRIGVAFEAQLVDSVPMEEHDQSMHILVTESRIIRVRERKDEEVIGR